MRDDERDELDALIDGALPGYSSAEPMDGLEQRVLQRVHSAGAGRPNPWRFRLALAIPALAALLVAGIVLRTWWNPRSHTVNTKPSHAAPNLTALKVPSPGPGARMSPAPRAQKPRRRIGNVQERSFPAMPLPKEEHFPSPAPMTNEERALVVWASRAPLEARQAFADLQKRNEEPVSIQPIQMQPLQSDGTQ